MHTDSTLLTQLERMQAAIDDALSALAEKYHVRMTTPYASENFGDVRRAIQDSKPSVSFR
jgi:hypothetical protein